MIWRRIWTVDEFLDDQYITKAPGETNDEMVKIEFCLAWVVFTMILFTCFMVKIESSPGERTVHTNYGENRTNPAFSFNSKELPPCNGDSLLAY